MKKIVFTCVLLILIIYSFFFPEIIVNAARKGIQIWFHQILPALLPFTILSAILIKSNFLESFNGNANLVAILLTMSCGFVFGFPVGAKLTSDFYKQKLLSEKQASYLAVAVNNFSPMYVCGFAMSLLFSSSQYNLATYLLLYLIPLVIVTICIIWNCKISSYEKPSASFRLDMHVINDSIISGFESLIKICGYIVLFSIIMEIITNTMPHIINQSPFIATVLLGNFEITNGIHLLAECNIAENLKYIAAIQILSFGGLSGIAQTGSILFGSGLSIYKYIIGKALLSLLLTLLTVIYVLLFV